MMQLKRLIKTKRNAALMLGGLLLLGLGGCLNAYVDAGPNPAVVPVKLRAQVSKAEITQALHSHGEFGMPLVAGQFRTITGPYWKWQLLYIKDDGGLWDLRTKVERSHHWIEGHQLNGQADYLLPPGRHRVRLLIQAYMEVSFRESWMEEVSEPVEIKSYSEDIELDLKPGQVFGISRDLTQAK
jgi:hypothetical protein